MPTVQAILDNAPPARPLDGIDVLPLLNGACEERSDPIAFQSPLRGARWEKQEGKESLALVGKRYKILSLDGGSSFQLYDLAQDPGETTDLASKHPEILLEMNATLRRWMNSCAESARGEDYR